MKEVTINESLDLLLESWDLLREEGNIVSKYDALALTKIPSVKGKSFQMNWFYQTHLYPMPWWGNISKPRVVVLSLNPSYTPISSKCNVGDDYENIELKCKLEKNVSKTDFESIDYLKLNKEPLPTQVWWKEDVFKNLFGTEEWQFNEQDIYRYFGFFNLCGYRSKSYNKIESKCLIRKNEISPDSVLRKFIEKFKDKYGEKSYDYDYLPTQNALREHLKKIIELDSTFVIVIWGYTEWKKFLKDKLYHAEKGENCKKYIEKHEKLLIVNKYNSHNKSIFYSYSKDKEKIMEYLNKVKKIILWRERNKAN